MSSTDSPEYTLPFNKAAIVGLGLIGGSIAAGLKQQGVEVSAFDQDMSNIPEVEKGMRASKKGAVTYANYQESRIRHYHQTIDKYISKVILALERNHGAIQR